MAAVMFTDMVGYTALAQKNESLSLALVEQQGNLLRPIFKRHHGREIKTIGDAFLVEFANALDAVRCAYDIQRASREFNISQPNDTRIRLRVGLHLGDVEESNFDIFGDAVNVASRIEPLAEDGGVCVTRQVYDQVQNKFELPLTSLGTRALKNVSSPIEVYKMVMPWDETKPAQPSQLERKRVAVLPFANISPENKDEYFADGLTEELITTLSRLRGLQVIARTSVMPYKGASKRVSEIGRELEVGSILEGSVRKVANKIRVTTQLIETATQTHIWSDTYDRELDDIFAIQSDIAKRVAQALQVELHAGEEKRIQTGLTQDLDAYAFYLRGRQLMYDRTEKSLGEAQKQFEMAFTKDPKFAAAYAGFADCLHLIGPTIDRPGRDTHTLSKAMVTKALELDDNLAEAHSTLGKLLTVEYEYAKSELEFKRAISLNPSYAQAHHWYALTLATLRRFDEAFLEMELARKTDPFSPVIQMATGALYWYAGRDEEALKHWLALKERMPNYHGVYQLLGLYFLDKGRTEEAFENLRSPVRAAHSNEAEYKLFLAYGYAVSGKREEALKLLTELENLQRRRYVSPLAFALIHLGLGDIDRFFDYMTRQIEEHGFWGPLGIRDFRPFKRVRSDPRFSSLLRKMNLEP